MKQLLIVMVVLIGLMFPCSQGIAADKLTTDQQTNLKLEFENIQLKNQLMQEAFTKNQARLQEIAQILGPYLTDTKGATPPKGGPAKADNKTKTKKK
jgi:hypothetical protein